ncbi:MAG: M16 family metallopeptidase [Pyrinomonadaceae bacterium]
MKRRSLQLLLLHLFLAAAAVAQVNLSAPIPTDPNVRIGKLGNGLTYYIRKNSKPENKVELRLAVNVGSTSERNDQQGLAHFLEHMAFNGTKNFQKNELVSFLQSIGVRFGADLNAYTSFDETVYILSIPTEKKELIDKGLLVLNDWASSITLDPEEIQKERGVVLEELRLGTGAEQRMRDRYFPKIFKGSAYAERLPIGHKEILEKFDPKLLTEFYEDWYRPDLMAIIAVGSLDVDEMEKKIKANFAGVKAKRKEKQKPVVTVPDHKETLIAVETDKEASNTSAQLIFKKPIERPKIKKDLRGQLVKNFFNGMLNARLDEIRQGPNPPFVFGGAGFGGFVRNKGAYSVFSITDTASVSSAIKVFLDENNRVKQFGFTPAEFERQKERYFVSLENNFKEREKTESWIFAGQYVSHFLEGNPAAGIEFQYNFAKAVVPTLTLKEINDLAKDAITTENRVVVVTGPEKSGAIYPTQAEIVALLKQAETAKLTAYVDDAVEEVLVGDLPAKAKITEEKTDDKFGITYWTLSNGVKIVLKPTDFKADQILMRSFSPGGLSIVADEKALSGNYLGQIAGESGLKKLSSAQLTKLLSGKRANASISVSDLYEYVNGSSTPKDFETMLQLAYLQFSDVNFDQAAFDSFFNKQRKFVGDLLANPQIYFSSEVGKIMSQNHPRSFGFPTLEQLDKIKLDDVKSIYTDRFSDASDFTFIFVGNFDNQNVKPLILKYLGNLPTKKRFEAWKDLGIRPPDGKVEKLIRKGVDQKSQVQIIFTGPAKFDRDEARSLSALGELLTIKLTEILREEKSGVYGVGANGSLSKIPYERYNFSIGFPCGPENVESLTAAALAEIVKVQKGEIEDKDIEKVKEARRIKAREDVKRNEYWSLEISRSLLQDVDLYSLDDLEKRINAITKEDLQAAAKKYVKLDERKQFVLLPEMAAAAKAN